MKTSQQITALPSPTRECHTCPLNGKGSDYCWKKCLGPSENSNKGISKVSLGGMEAPDEFIHRNAAADYRSQEARTVRRSSVTAKLDYEVERALVKVLATFMSLPDIQLCLFRHIYNGENLALAGRNCIRPMSRQAASKHVKAMRRSDPIIAKVMRQLVRLPDDDRQGDNHSEVEDSDVQTRDAVQLDLFGNPVERMA